jgi:hypothetical protein
MFFSFFRNLAESRRLRFWRVRIRRCLVVQPYRLSNLCQFVDIKSASCLNNSNYNNHNQSDLITINAFHCIQSSAKLFDSDIWLRKVTAVREVARVSTRQRALRPVLDSYQFCQRLGLHLLETMCYNMPLLAGSATRCTFTSSAPVTGENGGHSPGNESRDLHFLANLQLWLQQLTRKQKCLWFLFLWKAPPLPLID